MRRIQCMPHHVQQDNLMRIAVQRIQCVPHHLQEDNLLRVAVVGAGSISREFSTRHFGPSTNTRVACVVDIDESRARALATDVGSIQAGCQLLGGNRIAQPIPHFTELTSEALATCDCVYIGTPPSAHAALVLRSLASGKHVILEKPIAASREDSDTIVVAAQIALQQRQLHTSLNIGMRWNSALARMRMELEHGRLGHLQDGYLRLHFRKWPRDWQVQPWCARRAEGGPLREVGTHFLFGIHELFGHGCVNRVRAQVTYEDGPGGVGAETSALAILELQPGILGCEAAIPIHVSVLTHGQTELEQQGRDLYELEIRGANGSLCLFDFASLRDSQGRILVQNAPYGRHECITELLEVVAGRPSKMVTAVDARNAQRVLDAMLASRGEWVKVLYT